MDFPYESIFDPNSVSFLLEEKWLYVRQTHSALQLVSGGNQQIVYALVLDTIPVEADRRNVSSTDETNCNKRVLRVLSNGTLYVLAQCNTVATTPLVKLWQITSTQAAGGDPTEDLGMSQTVIDGQVKLCAPGCSDCSSGACKACSDGYIFDSDSSTCFICPAGCTVCSASDPNSCSACIDGAYLSGTECLPCDPICVTCNVTANSCQSCMPGEYFAGACY